MIVGKKQNNNIQVEMAVKNLAFNIFSAVLAVAVVLMNWMSCCVLKVLKPVQNKSKLARIMTNRWVRVTDSGKREIIEFVQIMINLVIGVAFSGSLIASQSFFVETIVTITYQLHLVSLNWAVDLPDYSTVLQESEAFQMFTTFFYFLFGLIGLSTQISFTLDLISIFSYPFRALKRACEKACEHLVNLKNIMISILTIKKKYWVTCPYPEYLLNDCFKIVYICALPVVFYLILLTKIYSLLLGVNILICSFIQSIGANIALFLEEIGRMTCTMLGLDIEDESLCTNQLSLKDRLESIKCKLSLVEWESVFNLKKLKGAFMGRPKESNSFEEPMTCQFISIISVYEKFSQYLH